MADNVIDVTKELKKAERREKFENFKTKCKDWWEDNKTYVVLFGPGVLAVLKSFRRLASVTTCALRNGRRICGFMTHPWVITGSLRESLITATGPISIENVTEVLVWDRSWTR